MASLVSLPEINMESLKTIIILSDCSNLEEFQVISEQLEAVYLDGTSLKALPPSIIKLQKLVLLNLKDCTKLATMPDCLGNMKALQINATLIFSNCNKLDEDAKTCIVSYIQKKSNLLSDALDRYNLGAIVESFVGASFPGCEVHAWLSHQAYGSVIADDVSTLPPDSEESDELEINKQDETNSCLSSEDHENSSVHEESGRVTENTSVQIKPVRFLCLIISISAGAAFIPGKDKEMKTLHDTHI